MAHILNFAPKCVLYVVCVLVRSPAVIFVAVYYAYATNDYNYLITKRLCFNSFQGNI